MRRALLVAALFWGGCQSKPLPEKKPEPAQTAERRFVAPSGVQGPAVNVTEVLAHPERYLNKTIKCEGTVSRVCEAAGCWLELRAAAADAPGLRVPMAGHSFFIPKDAVGRPAVVEGTLAARELNDSELAHLQGEGLKAIGPLYLAATSVVIR